MGAKVCGKCKRGYPKYLERCPTCNPRGKIVGIPKAAMEAVTRAVVAERALNAGALVTNAEPLVNAPALVPGEPCYACGRKVPKSAKQRYAEWKERQK